MLTLTQRQKLLAHCIQHPTNSFFRTLYNLKEKELLTLHTEEDWRALPIMTKDHLIEAPLEQRSLLPLNQLDHIRASSGTSGKPPLFSPRTHVRGMDYRLQYHDFKNPFLAFSVPMMPHWHEMVQESKGYPPRIITYDPRFPDVSIHLATQAGVDGASLFLFHIQTAGDAMKKTGLNTHIRFLEVTGEMCSQATYAYMQETFPNATILQSYGASEVEDVHIGIPCKPMDGSDPLAVYHPKHTHFLEIMNRDGTILEPHVGAEGDILITAYPDEPSAFPLIRFKIGDTIRVVESACSHEEWSFTVLGRTELDFVKVHGGVLRADEIARVLRQFPATVTDNFELHRYEKGTTEGPRTWVKLLVEPVEREIDLEQLAHTLAKHIRVGPVRTYADGVDKGFFLPMICEQFDTPKEGLQKHRRIISHSDE